MVEKSAVLVLVLTLVLALSFRDIMVNSHGSQSEDLDESDGFDNFDDQNSEPLDHGRGESIHDFEEDFDGGEAERLNLKKIPSLKMKGMAAQTVKFKFW